MIDRVGNPLRISFSLLSLFLLYKAGDNFVCLGVLYKYT